jgi:MFS family permease
MEKYGKHRSLLSALVGTSGTVGSLVAFIFAWFYLNDYLPKEAWRYAFGLGAVVTYVNYILRARLKKQMQADKQVQTLQYPMERTSAILIGLSIGLLIGTMFYFPMVYTNFYLTKVLHYPVSTGLTATLIALLGSILLTPVFGMIADRFTPAKVMMWAALMAIPAAIVGFHLIEQGNLWGQLILITSIAAFGAPTHSLMNPLFSPEVRSRYVNTCFMLGTSLGSLSPFLSGILVDRFDFHQAPVSLVVGCAALTFGIFYKSFFSR